MTRSIRRPFGERGCTMEGMYPRVAIAILIAACGGDRRATIDGGPADAGPDAPPDAMIDARGNGGILDGPGLCPTDSVTTILPNNPGANASAYPAAGWWSDDTRANGTVVVDASLGTPPGFGCRAAVLTTGASTPSPSADKAQLITFALAGTPLASIATVSYWALRSSASTGGPAIDLSLNVTITGASVPGNFATLVYEPYHQSGGQGAIQLDAWQHWDATATTPGDGRWWTTKIPNGPSPGTPGSQSNPQPWAAFQTLYPDALVHGYGFDVGSVNPNMIVGGDGLVFGTTTTDF